MALTMSTLRCRKASLRQVWRQVGGTHHTLGGGEPCVDTCLSTCTINQTRDKKKKKKLEKILSTCTINQTRDKKNGENSQHLHNKSNT